MATAHIEIPLTRGQTALIDLDDYPIVKDRSWYADRKSRRLYYARTRIAGQRSPVYMHTLIAGYDFADHRNRNGLDNRRANLRSATHKINVINTTPREGCSSQYRGVSYDKKRNKWEAYINNDGKRKHLGRHDTEVAAALAYDAYAETLWGDDAPLNFPATSFVGYQRMARKFAQYPDMGNNLIYPALGLVGEAGEVAEKIKKIWRNHNLEMTLERRDEILKELSDVLWYLAALATELGISFQDVAQANLDKLADRQQRGVIKSEGDNR